jgi:Holliday junction DNA helicase RuvB
MRARFGIQSRLQYYNTELLTTIVQRSASILRVPITIRQQLKLQEEVAERQEQNTLLRRVRDFAQMKGNRSRYRNLQIFTESTACRRQWF